MIESGTLPEPQWITFGSRVERVYSLEWLLLASEQLNQRRLPGMEDTFDSQNMVHLAVRFEHSDWTLDEISQKLVALNDLWKLCAATINPDQTVGLPGLTVRRLSAGSPLDLLASISLNWNGVLGTGGLAAMFIYLVRNPTKVAEAIPRAVTAWRENWAKADEAKVHQLTAKIDRKDFEQKAKICLNKIDSVPSVTALSGTGTSRLELLAIEDQSSAGEGIRTGEGLESTVTKDVTVI
ncbi:hypothetical protein GY21_16745 [Cryobacterium roopkundense]|nr:hypothetical protein GY21_16745 [Cryobacterium roopkundense]